MTTVALTNDAKEKMALTFFATDNFKNLVPLSATARAAAFMPVIEADSDFDKVVFFTTNKELSEDKRITYRGIITGYNAGKTAITEMRYEPIKWYRGYDFDSVPGASIYDAILGEDEKTKLTSAVIEKFCAKYGYGGKKPETVEFYPLFGTRYAKWEDIKRMYWAPIKNLLTSQFISPFTGYDLDNVKKGLIAFYGTIISQIDNILDAIKYDGSSFGDLRLYTQYTIDEKKQIVLTEYKTAGRRFYDFLRGLVGKTVTNEMLIAIGLMNAVIDAIVCYHNSILEAIRRSDAKAGIIMRHRPQSSRGGDLFNDGKKGVDTTYGGRGKKETKQKSHIYKSGPMSITKYVLHENLREMFRTSKLSILGYVKSGRETRSPFEKILSTIEFMDGGSNPLCSYRVGNGQRRPAWTKVELLTGDGYTAYMLKHVLISRNVDSIQIGTPNLLTSSILNGYNSPAARAGKEKWPIIDTSYILPQLGTFKKAVSIAVSHSGRNLVDLKWLANDKYSIGNIISDLKLESDATDLAKENMNETILTRYAYNYYLL